MHHPRLLRFCTLSKSPRRLSVTVKISILTCRPIANCKFRKMKTTGLFLALVFGCLSPIYSQLNRHHRGADKSDQLENKEDNDFGNYNFIDKFPGTVETPAPDNFGMSRRPWPIYNGEIQFRSNMPCFHPKSGDKMPCLKPEGTFPMRVFKPKDSIWGILW